MGLIIIPGQSEPEGLDGPADRIETLGPEDLEQLVREAVERNRKARRTSPGQLALDRAVEALAREGEIHLASALLLLSAHRVACTTHVANQMLWQLAIDMDLPRPRVCRVCGCTDGAACRDAHGRPCHWWEDDLCSACVGRERPA